MTIETTLSDILSELRTITKAMAGGAAGQLPLPLSLPVPVTQTITLPADTTIPAPAAVFGSGTTVLPSAAMVPVAPLVPPPPSPPNPGVSSPTDSTRDARGFTWDGRIHASSRAKIADGTWRAKRGVDPALVQTVEAELSQAASAPAPTVLDAPGAIDFTRFVVKLSVLMSKGDITQEQLNAACAAHGVPNTAALASRPDLVPAVAAVLGVA